MLSQPFYIFITLCLSFLTAIFPGGPALAGTRMSPNCILLVLKVMEVVVATEAINRRTELQSSRYHQQTNAQLFTGQMPFLSPNERCQSAVYYSLFYITFFNLPRPATVTAAATATITATA